ncbi:cell division protein ZipA [Photobacterium japonica]|uniref:cell division protein ZipA n=1 Tax=Photobacterium japonica TaxID=2910235 RepID=UPI003D12A948
MQELRLVLIIVGALAIAALLLHGLWSSRKEKPAKFGEKPLGKLDDSSRDSDGFDHDGVGSVRVMNNDTAPVEPLRTERKEPALHFGAKPEADPLLDGLSTDIQPGDNVPADSVPVAHPEPVVEPQPVVAPQATASQGIVQRAMAQNVMSTAEVTAPQMMTPEVSVAPQTQTVSPRQVSHAAAPAAKPAPIAEPTVTPASAMSEPAVQTRVEPTLSAMNETPVIEPTLTIEDIERGQQQTAVEDMIVVEPSDQPFQVEQPTGQPQPAEQRPVVAPEPVMVSPVAAQPQAAMPEPEPEPEPEVLPPDFLVLNVHARHGDVLRGNKLFTAFEQHNLIFGDNAVYHRHSDMAGTGPSLFCATNMVHPAHFPVGGNEQFETPGVAFYLMLPCQAGRADQSFNLMLQTVQRIADVLEADVLDHERNLITPRRITEYREKAMRYSHA